MVNYSNGKVYKIEPIQGGDIYVGSTTKQYLSQRMDTHRKCYKQWKKGERGKTMSFDIFDKYGLENCQIILLENVNCNDKNELLAREAHWIKELNCLNKVIPLQTKKEYYEKNREIIMDKKKIYRKNNLEERKEYDKNYYEKNKNSIREYKKKYQEQNKVILSEKKKQYYQQNKEKISDKRKTNYHTIKETTAKQNQDYYQTHKQEILEKKKEKITCVCGSQHRKADTSRHQKTQKHILYLEKNSF